MTVGPRGASPFALAVAAVSLLVTLVVAGAIRDAARPDPDREARRERRAYYERTLRRADVSWKEGVYYRVMDGAGGRR